jgi:hypothetical protein
VHQQWALAAEMRRQLRVGEELRPLLHGTVLLCTAWSREEPGIFKGSCWW